MTDDNNGKRQFEFLSTAPCTVVSCVVCRVLHRTIVTTTTTSCGRLISRHTATQRLMSNISIKKQTKTLYYFIITNISISNYYYYHLFHLYRLPTLIVTFKKDTEYYFKSR